MLRTGSAPVRSPGETGTRTGPRRLRLKEWWRGARVLVVVVEVVGDVVVVVIVTCLAPNAIPLAVSKRCCRGGNLVILLLRGEGLRKPQASSCTRRQASAYDAVPPIRLSSPNHTVRILRLLLLRVTHPHVL